MIIIQWCIWTDNKCLKKFWKRSFRYSFLCSIKYIIFTLWQWWRKYSDYLLYKLSKYAWVLNLRKVLKVQDIGGTRGGRLLHWWCWTQSGLMDRVSKLLNSTILSSQRIHQCFLLLLFTFPPDANLKKKPYRNSACIGHIK